MEPLLGVAWGVAVVAFDDMIGGQQPRRTIAAWVSVEPSPLDP